jgi:MFS family permease
MIPFGLFLGITGFGIGIISSFNGLLSPIGQIIGSNLMESQTRKKILTKFLFAQSIIWLVLILLTFSVLNLWILKGIAIIFFSAYILYILFGAVVGPSWFSLMADIVPNEIRGEYFGKRNFYTSIIGLLFVYVFSMILDHYKLLNNLAIGFIIIFTLCFLTRQISIILVRKHYYPYVIYEKKAHVKLSTFFSGLTKTNFGRFCLFVALINMGQAIAGPFFSVYMLTELNFTYEIYALILLSNSVIAILVFPIAGKLTDKYGNINVLKFGAIIIPTLPIMWIFLTNPYAIMAGPQFFGGIGWTMFNLAASNFLIEAIPPKKRGYYLAYYNLLIGIGIFLGSLMGSILFSIMDPFGLSFKAVFLVSGVFRGAVVIFLISKIKEIREKIAKQQITTEEKKVPITKLQTTSIHRGTHLSLGIGRLRIRRKIITKYTEEQCENKEK